LTRINDMPAEDFFKLGPMQLVLEKWLLEVTALPFDKWVEAVAALPAEKQLAAVDVKLAERNGVTELGRQCVIRPNFGVTTIEDGVVTKVEVDQYLPDVSPVRALTRLRVFHSGGSLGKFADLSMLKGLQLTGVEIAACAVADHAPLQGMPLTRLSCGHTFVKDLSPLKGMKLTALSCVATEVKDLSPLQGMPLTHLDCGQTKVTDLSPLRGMPLKVLNCDFKPERDAAILREIKTLETINGKPAAQFWKDVDALPKKP
jgi:hypothetical protein